MSFFINLDMILIDFDNSCDHGLKNGHVACASVLMLSQSELPGLIPGPGCRPDDVEK